METSYPVNDVVVHPNQGELISCDQAGRIKQWDLSENICTHELVCNLARILILRLQCGHCRLPPATLRCVRSASLPMAHV